MSKAGSSRKGLGAQSRAHLDLDDQKGRIISVKALYSGETGELAIHPDQLYADLQLTLNLMFTDGPDLTLLEQVDGPRPYWWYPAPQAKVSMYCQKLYAVGRSTSPILATVRTPKSDIPILIPVDQQDFGTLTIDNLIKPALEKEGLTMKKVTVITGGNDIRTETYTHSHVQSPYFPTVFFVEAEFNPDVLQFRTVVPDSIPPPMQTILINAETLVMKVVHAKFCSLQAIHLARSLLHLVINMIDDAAHSSPRRWLWQVKDLESALISVENNVGELSPERLLEPSFQKRLDDLFHTLCYERSGVVAIRNSYLAFCQLSELDRAALASPPTRELSSAMDHDQVLSGPERIMTFDGFFNFESEDTFMLGQLGEPSELRRAIPQIIELLNDNDSDIRAGAASVLGILIEYAELRSAVGTAIPRLTKHLRDIVSDVRAAAAAALVKLAGHAELRSAVGDAIPRLIELLKDIISDVRAAAASALGILAEHAALRSAVGDAIPLLIELLKDIMSDVRAAAASTLGILVGHAELQSAVSDAIPRLTELLKDNFSDVQAAAASALVNLAEHAELRATVGDAIPQPSKLPDDGVYDVRSSATFALIKLAEHTELRRAVGNAITQLVKLFEDSVSDVRAAAAFALEKLAEHGELQGAVGDAIPHLVNLLKDGVPDVRATAASALVKLAEHAELRSAIADAIPQLLKFLDHGFSEVRVTVVSVLVKLAEHAELREKVRAAIPQLTNLLYYGFPEVRVAAASALGKMAEHAELQKDVGRAIPQLIKLLDASFTEIQVAAASALVELAECTEFRSAVGAAIPQLIKLLNDRSIDVQVAAASAVEKLAEHVELHRAIGAATPQLIELLNDSNSDTRAAAASALAKLAEHDDHTNQLSPETSHNQDTTYYGSLYGAMDFPSRATLESTAGYTPEPVGGIPMDARKEDYIRYYGHKKRNEINEDSSTIQTNLLSFSMSQSPPNEALRDALTKIFDSDAWRNQSAPVDVELLRNEALRKKEIDGEGKVWYPCQLGCPDGLAETQTGKKSRNTQPQHATTHIEWHLGMHRHVCDICLDTFSYAQSRDDHRKKHSSTIGVSCPNKCGVKFTDNNEWNIKRHLKFFCTRAQESTSN